MARSRAQFEPRGVSDHECASTVVENSRIPGEARRSEDGVLQGTPPEVCERDILTYLFMPSPTFMVLTVACPSSLGVLLFVLWVSQLLN